MGTIQYTLAGTQTPFGVELRQDSINGAVQDSVVVDDEGTYQFNNVHLGSYVVVE